MRTLRTLALAFALCGCGNLYDPTESAFAVDTALEAVPLKNLSRELRLTRTGDAKPAETVRISVSGADAQLSLATSGPWGTELEVSFADGEAKSIPFFAQGVRAGFVPVAFVSARTGKSTGTLEVSAEIFADDFEAPAVRLVPEGPWEKIALQAGVDVTLGVSAEAAHRGTMGLRVVDADDNQGVEERGAPARISADFVPYAGNHYLRLWIRVSSASSVGSVHVLELLRAHAGTDVLDAFCSQVMLPGFELVPGGYATGEGNPYFFDVTAASVASGTWHLFEAEVLRLGTASGERSLWLDGVEVAHRSGLDFTEETFVSDAVGIPYSNDMRFVGTVDVDDVRGSEAPPASRLQVETGTAEGGCVAVTASLVDSVGRRLAPAPYAVTLTVAGATFVDRGCARKGEVIIPRGNPSVEFFVKSGGRVAVSHPDFLPSGEVEVSGGGCSVGGSEPMLWLALASVMSGLRSRTRRYE